MSQVIGILSGKGGVGKTSVVANLGAALTNEFDKNIIILDANLNSSHLGLHLGMYEDLPVTLREVLKKNMPVSYAIYVHPSTGIRIVPAALSGDGVKVTTAKLRNITKKLTSDYELVIMDCPPGLGKESVTAIGAIDSGLIVTTPDFPAVADALKTVQLLERMGKKVIGLVVNKRKGEKYELTIKEIESTCGVKVISIIPEDNHVPEGISEGVPVVLLSPYSKASVAFKQLAATLVGETYSPGGIFDRIMSFFSRPKVPQADQKMEPEQRLPELGGQPDAVRTIRKETRDVDEITKQLRKEIRDELKKEILQKVRQRISE